MLSAFLLLIFISRVNLFLEVKHRQPSTGGHFTSEESVNAVVDPYLEELRIKGTHFPKSIMYTKLEWCGYIHNRALSNFLAGHPDQTTVQQADATNLECIIQQYHAPQTSQASTMADKCHHNMSLDLQCRQVKNASFSCFLFKAMKSLKNDYQQCVII